MLLPVAAAWTVNRSLRLSMTIGSERSYSRAARYSLYSPVGRGDLSSRWQAQTFGVLKST